MGEILLESIIDVVALMGRYGRGWEEIYVLPWQCGDSGKLFRIIAPFLPSLSPTPFAVEVMTFSFIEQREKEEADRPRPSFASPQNAKRLIDREREYRAADRRD